MYAFFQSALLPVNFPKRLGLPATFATETFEKLHFDSHRLGIIRSNSSEMEPVLRNTNLFAMDMSAVRYADAPGCANASPNGLNGEDACQLAYYAGLSLFF